MSYAAWKKIVCGYHVVYALAVIWPVQALVVGPEPFVLGLPLSMVWCTAWVLGSLAMLWRLDSARDRHASASRASGRHGS